jgi:hypothetical protein
MLRDGKCALMLLKTSYCRHSPEGIGDSVLKMLEEYWRPSQELLEIGDAFGKVPK